MSSLFEVWFRHSDEAAWYLYEVLETQLLAEKYVEQVSAARVNWKFEIREAQYADDELQRLSSDELPGDDDRSPDDRL